MSERVNIADISWPEFERRIAAGAVVFVPVGATEQHGRHLPLGVDAVIPSAICERLARFCGGLGNVQRVDVLPFHQMGQYKWRELGLPYQLADAHPPSPELLERVKEQFRAKGLRAP